MKYLHGRKTVRAARNADSLHEFRISLGSKCMVKGNSGINNLLIIIFPLPDKILRLTTRRRHFVYERTKAFFLLHYLCNMPSSFLPVSNQLKTRDVRSVTVFNTHLRQLIFISLQYKNNTHMKGALRTII